MAKKATYIAELKKAINQIDLKVLESISDYLIFSVDNNIFLCGNGGSSSTCQHIANDLVKMCNLNAICLTDNTATLTACANDISYEAIFDRQLKVMSGKGDILIVISGSGKSKNILSAIDYANKNSMNIIAIIGMDGGEVINKRVDKLIHIKTDMQHFEDCSLVVGHIITMNIYGNQKKII